MLTPSTEVLVLDEDSWDADMEIECIPYLM